LTKPGCWRCLKGTKRKHKAHRFPSRAGAAAGAGVGEAFDGAEFAFALAVPGFRAPVARVIAGWLFRERGRLGGRSGRHWYQFSGWPERLAPGHGWQRRGYQTSGRLYFLMRAVRGKAGIGGGGLVLDRNILCGARWDAHGKGSGHEFVHQLVEAGLPAQMLHPRTQAIARVPAADAQLSALLRGNKPVVGLFLFRCANVTRYCLPDHCIPPKAAPSRRGVKCLARSFPSTAGAMILTPQPEPANPIGIVWESPLSISSRVGGKRSTSAGKECGDASKLNEMGKDRP